MTKLLFLKDAYMTKADVYVTKVFPEGVVLDKTIFYPLGGGQDTDTGTINLQGTSYTVKSVKKEGENIVHFLEEGTSEIHEGDKVKLKLDWERRYTHMKYHTALHILSKVAYSTYGATITGNQITQEKARIDLTLEGLDKEVVKKIEEDTNSHIEKNMAVTVREVTREDAIAIVDPKITRLDLIPPSIKNIRLVEVGGVDIDACGGTHVHNTQEIGKIEIFKTINKGRGRKRLELRLVRV